MRDNSKMPVLELLEQRTRLWPQVRLELQRADAVIHAPILPVGAEKDDGVAWDALVTQRRSQVDDLLRALEMARRLYIAKGPAWRHWRESGQPSILRKNRFRIGRKQEVAVELASLGGIHEVAALVAAAERHLGVP